MDRYLAVGINAYRSAPLRGCVNDANDVGDYLERYGYQGTRLLDAAATGGAIREGLAKLVSDAKRGDRIVAHYSGHGTNVRDLNGDEPDRRDEAICPVDYQQSGVILDDELKVIYAARKAGVRLVVLSDSCYSGTISDNVRGLAATFTTGYGTPRFVHDEDLPLPEVDVRQLERLTRRAKLTTPIPPLLVTGCDAHEVSWDGVDGRGRPCGAMTNALLTSLALLGPDAKWAAAHKRMRDTSKPGGLPSDRYPQSPQLEATAWQRRWKLRR